MLSMCEALGSILQHPPPQKKIPHVMMQVGINFSTHRNACYMRPYHIYLPQILSLLVFAGRPT
jgi:hypothetical protein